MQDQARSNLGLRKLASRISLGVAILLVALKLFAWLMTGSVALLTSTIDALVDTAASFVTYFAVRYAERPPDQDHRFGHGKGEAVAAFTQAMFLAGASLVLGFQSIERLISPEPLASLPVGLGVITTSLIAAAGLVIMQSWVVKKTASTAIAADRAHYLTDVAVNIAVLAALVVIVLTGWQRADPTFAFAISGFMLWSAGHIVREALIPLLDREIPGADRQRIKETVLGCSGFGTFMTCGHDPLATASLLSFIWRSMAS